MSSWNFQLTSSSTLDFQLFLWFSQALKINNYDAEPLLRSCGISISNNFTQVEGRVLPAPKVHIYIGEMSSVYILYKYINF